MDLLKGSSERVRVAVRVRNIPTRVATVGKRGRALSPLQRDTKAVVAEPNIDPQTRIASSLTITDPEGRKGQKEFTYDRVFSMHEDQQTVYDAVVKPIISRCLDGYNGCIFAYGQTGSGKTYTMEGREEPKERGVILRAAEQITSHILDQKKKSPDVEYRLSGSYLEIYQEKLKDLLQDDPQEQEELRIRIDPQSISGKDLYVEHLTERTLVTMSDFARMIHVGTQRRTVAETNMNEVSSRSHAVLTITIKQFKRLSSKVSLASGDEPVGGVVQSKIHLIDLAGSERAYSTGATGERLKEGSAINQSLSSLGNVINALSTNAGHVPYRDSKLTYLLSDSLGGNSITLVLACVTPVAAAYEESVSTLRFAERAKKIQNKARINMDPTALRYNISLKHSRSGRRSGKIDCFAQELHMQEQKTHWQGNPGLSTEMVGLSALSDTPSR
ncbi:P-loop containing nucleoside triphosphate hydrolase protein [Gorgonomyces haynaldii]|nr:P-loop containing nucleoside triphosphate hydrolase protein [Gorgonomyces haynaldii]